ncbi:methyltransferase domain protein [Ceratobasidium sp. AG-Ba]|nr:methyltransferase domain protein [Ceratobasidium sp. AG-Ba]
MDPGELEPAPVYYVDDIDSEDERSDPELYSASSMGSQSAETIASSQVHGETYVGVADEILNPQPDSNNSTDYFQEAHGRMFPADRNVAISLPTDSVEVQRCADQHQALKLLLGSNYWGPVDEVLAPAQGLDRKKVLDMMTAEGTWAQEMGQQFPHVDIISLDNFPLCPHIPRPNVAFEVYDLYNGIAAPDATFDVVHLRHTMMHLRNPKDFIIDVHRVLKPGGLFLFSKSELDGFDGRNPEFPALSSLPALCEGFQITRHALSQQGVDVHMWRDLPGWLSPDSDLWVPQRPAKGGKLVGFRDIRFKSVIIPAGPWEEEERLKEVGRIVQRAWSHIWTSMEAPLQVFGLDAARAKQVVRGAVGDIRRSDVAVAAKHHLIYAFKI